MSEQWREVPGFPGYEISDLGRVRSWRPWRGQPVPRLMKALPDSAGYLRVAPFRDGTNVFRSIHRLVMEAFVGPPPDGMETRHLNGDKTDNRLINLAYGTRSENTYDQVQHGTHVAARKTHCDRGHAFDEANTYQRARGGRTCRACARITHHLRKEAST